VLSGGTAGSRAAADEATQHIGELVRRREDREVPLAFELVERALRLNPHPPSWYERLVCRAYFWARRFYKAIALINRKDVLTPEDHHYLAMSHAQLGHDVEAATSAVEFMSSSPEFSAERGISEFGSFPREAELIFWLDSHRKAGLPICATEAQLAGWPDMKRLPQCDAERARS
jgi:hypothetical protein